LRSWVIRGEGLRRFLRAKQRRRKGNRGARDKAIEARTAESATQARFVALNYRFQHYYFKGTSELARAPVFRRTSCEVKFARRGSQVCRWRT